MKLNQGCFISNKKYLVNLLAFSYFSPVNMLLIQCLTL